MRKPAHQWETHAYRAIRRAEIEPEWRDEPRAEAFDLVPLDERPAARAWLSLERQVVTRHALLDPNLIHAVSCWLVARGAREIRLMDEEGAVIEERALHVWGLGTPPIKSPSTLVSLCPSNAEMLGALGCFDRVIACEDSSDYPPEVAERERLGPDLAPDLDRVAELRPELVVASLSVPGMERVVTGLRVRGLPLAVLAPRSIADVQDEIIALGRWLGVDERAREVVAGMEAECRELMVGRPKEPVRVYLEWWPRPMFSPASECYSNELIELAGGINVFGERPGSSLEIRAEELVAEDPEVCFVSWCGVAEAKLDPQNLVERPGLGELKAAQQGRVYVLDEAFAGRPGPRMLEAARRMAVRIREVVAAKDAADTRAR